MARGAQAGAGAGWAGVILTEEAALVDGDVEEVVAEGMSDGGMEVEATGAAPSGGLPGRGGHRGIAVGGWWLWHCG